MVRGPQSGWSLCFQKGHYPLTEIAANVRCGFHAATFHGYDAAAGCPIGTTGENCSSVYPDSFARTVIMALECSPAPLSNRNHKSSPGVIQTAASPGSLNVNCPF